MTKDTDEVVDIAAYLKKYFIAFISLGLIALTLSYATFETRTIYQLKSRISTDVQSLDLIKALNHPIIENQFQVKDFDSIQNQPVYLDVTYDTKVISAYSYEKFDKNVYIKFIKDRVLSAIEKSHVTDIQEIIIEMEVLEKLNDSYAGNRNYDPDNKNIILNSRINKEMMKLNKTIIDGKQKLSQKNATLNVSDAVTFTYEDQVRARQQHAFLPHTLRYLLLAFFVFIFYVTISIIMNIRKG